MKRKKMKPVRGWTLISTIDQRIKPLLKTRGDARAYRLCMLTPQYWRIARVEVREI